MAAVAPPQFSGLRCPTLSKPSPSPIPLGKRTAFHSKPPISAAAAAANVSNAQTRERERLKDLFREARERCVSFPTEGVCFTVDDFHAALDERAFGTEVGCKVRGRIFTTDIDGALVDIKAKSLAYLPLKEACIHRINHVEEAGIYPGLEEEFVVVGESTADESLILSLRSAQHDLAWERCRQLEIEDAIVNGKVVGANRGGIVVAVEGLHGFVPFSQISNKSTAEDLINKELPLKFVEVDEKQSKLVLSNRKAMVDCQVELETGSVILGTVRSLKPYGAIVDVGGIRGLLHVSQISHGRVTDIAAVLQPGDALKVMILSYDTEREQVSLSTKNLEPTPGDMIRNPKLVFDKADDMAERLRQRIAQAEAMAHTDLQKFQFESISSEGILGPISPDLPG